MSQRTCQPVYVHPDRGGGYAFEFDHVYGPGAAPDPRGPILVLNRDACYWRVTESKTRVARTLTFAAARQRRPTLTFSHFSSLTEMREELLALFA